MTVADARFAKPLDAALLAQLAAEHDLLVTVEEGVLAGGFGSAVWEIAVSGGVAAAADPAHRAAGPLRHARRAEAPPRGGRLHRRAHRRAGRGGRAGSARLAGVGLTPGTLGPVPRVRLDSLLAERGLYPSRSRAAAAVLAGEVRLGDGRALKPGQQVDPAIELVVDTPPPFVSRGGIKLANALDLLAVPVDGRDCLDVGASTGGFTDCLLQRGAARVIALDVAYGELDWRLRGDSRVTVLERVNARAMPVLPYAPSLVVVDVSFISLVKVLPSVLGSAAGEFDCLAMVKPQFEVGRGRVGKGGVVRDPALRREAVRDVALAARGSGASVMGFASSGLPGPAGNLETFVYTAHSFSTPSDPGDTFAVSPLRAIGCFARASVVPFPAGPGQTVGNGIKARLVARAAVPPKGAGAMSRLVVVAATCTAMLLAAGCSGSKSHHSDDKSPSPEQSTETFARGSVQ